MISSRRRLRENLNMDGARRATLVILAQLEGQSRPNLQIAVITAVKKRRARNKNIFAAVIAFQKAKAPARVQVSFAQVSETLYITHNGSVVADLAALFTDVIAEFFPGYVSATDGAPRCESLFTMYSIFAPISFCDPIPPKVFHGFGS